MLKAIPIELDGDSEDEPIGACLPGAGRKASQGSPSQGSPSQGAPSQGSPSQGSASRG